MGIRGWLAAGAAAVTMACAGNAGATVETITFTVNPGMWFYAAGSTPPYGLPDDPTLAGSVSIDTTQTGAAAFTALDFTAGTQTFTLADINPDLSTAYLFDDQVVGFALVLGTGDRPTAIDSLNTARLNDGVDIMACNACVTTSIPVVPEPATWAVLILGLGMLGANLRSRRGVEVPA